MALFGPKDSDVPLLTSFYQLEFTRDNLVGSELDVWLYRVFEPSPSAEIAGSNLCWTHGKPYELDVFILNQFADLHEVLHRVLPAIVDEQVPADEDLIKLNAILKEGMQAPEIGWFPGASGPYPVLLYRRNLPQMMRLLSEILDVMRKQSLSRCEVCANVFLPSRNGVRFCSRRCGNRAFMRASRKRAEQKAA